MKWTIYECDVSLWPMYTFKNINSPPLNVPLTLGVLGRGLPDAFTENEEKAVKNHASNITI